MIFNNTCHKATNSSAIKSANSKLQEYAFLQGVWETIKNDSTDQGTRFEIIDDSILYEDSPERLYKITKINSEIIIHLDGYDVSEKLISFGRDSFVVLRDGEQIKFFRISE